MAQPQLTTQQIQQVGMKSVCLVFELCCCFCLLVLSLLLLLLLPPLLLHNPSMPATCCPLLTTALNL
jgi:competence protein ComGC